MDFTWLAHPQAAGRGLVTAFFAIVFLQSAIDKLVDREGNIAFFSDHFKSSPLSGMVPMMFWALTLLEATAGGLCGLGLLRGDFAHKGLGLSACGIITAGVALLALLLGQRMAKDYAGAAVIAGYFAVALIGIGLF